MPEFNEVPEEAAYLIDQLEEMGFSGTLTRKDVEFDLEQQKSGKPQHPANWEVTPDGKIKIDGVVGTYDQFFEW